MSDRLDQVEATLVALAERQAAFQNQLDQQNREMRETFAAQNRELHDNIENVAEMVMALAQTTEEYRIQAEADRAEFRAMIATAVEQAALDRETFRRSVTDILTYLRERYNGHDQ